PQSDAEFARLVTVDYNRRFAMAAFGDDGTGIGIARYEGEPDADSAEVAVAVSPAWRRVGLASAMVRVLSEAAIANGITALVVEFLMQNVDVAALVRDSHLPVQRVQRDGVVQITIDLSAAENTLD